MVAPLKKFVKLVISKDRYFFTFIVIALFLSIPITVFAVLQSRDLRTEATHQDCFDLNGDFKVTQSDVDIILNTVAVGGYKPGYDINHDGKVSSVDAFLLLEHLGEVCVPVVSFWADSYTINQGNSTKIRWTTAYTTVVSISPSVGSTGLNGSKTVSPNSSTIYTLTATNQWATTRKYVTITVNVPSPEEPPGPEPPPPPPDSSSPTSPPGSLPGSTISPGPGGSSPVVQNVLNVLNLKISALPLVGETNLPLVIGGKAAQIRISKGIKTYSLNVSRNRFEFGEKITLLVGGSGVLTKKFSFTPDALTETINVGVISFGDISGNNRIDKEDVALILESIASQTNRGDINADGVANSLDWALLQANFGKVGD